MMMMKKKSSSNSRDNTAGTRSVPFDNECMLVEILSRLPVKSLLRFKCVSKRWCSLIQDPFFVDLHSARSITRPGATFFISRDFRSRSPNITFFGSTHYDGPHFHSIDYVSFISDAAGGHHKFGPHYYQTYYDFIGSSKLKSTQVLNGLLLMSFKQETVWILNPTTRQTILLTKTNIKEEEDEQTINNKEVVYVNSAGVGAGGAHQYNWMNKEAVVNPKYAFGFDPVTKKYKVICICEVEIWYIPPQMFLCHPDYSDHDFHPEPLNTYHRCMVLTIDNDDDESCSWRRINADEIPPYHLHDGSDPVYLNGVLYWRNKNSCDDKGPIVEVIVAFDVSSEKFSVITIPDFILEPSRPSFNYSDQELYGVDGYLAIVENKKSAARPNTIVIWKLVALPVSNAAAAAAADCRWVKETILTLSSFGWRKEGYLFEVINGTNQVLLKRYDSKNGGTSLCYYDRDNNGDDDNDKYKTKKKKENKKTRKMLEFSSECGSFTGTQPTQDIHRKIHTCTETLWSLSN